MYKQNLELGYQQWLICCKTQPNQIEQFDIQTERKQMPYDKLNGLK